MDVIWVDGTKVDLAGDVGVPSDVGVEVGAADAAVSVKFATTVCAAEVLMKATFGVGVGRFAGTQEISRNIPIDATMNNLVFILILLFVSEPIILKL